MVEDTRTDGETSNVQGDLGGDLDDFMAAVDQDPEGADAVTQDLPPNAVGPDSRVSGQSGATPPGNISAFYNRTIALFLL